MAKRARPNPESAAVVFDMSPWAQEFAEWREQQALREAQELEEQEQPESEMINALEETKGCAILDWCHDDVFLDSGRGRDLTATASTK